MKLVDVAIVLIALSLCSASVFALEVSTAQEQPGKTQSTESTGAMDADAASPQPEDEASGVMDEPLDGSSMEAFTAGLERLDNEASEKEYRTVMSALDYLLFYDIGAERNKAKLYSRLNGKSPNQILEIVASAVKRAGR